MRESVGNYPRAHGGASDEGAKNHFANHSGEDYLVAAEIVVISDHQSYVQQPY